MNEDKPGWEPPPIDLPPENNDAFLLKTIETLTNTIKDMTFALDIANQQIDKLQKAFDELKEEHYNKWEI